MGNRVRIVHRMRLDEITPDWIRLRLSTKGMSIGDLAVAIPLERTKLSKSLNGKRNLLGWELDRIRELLADAGSYTTRDPELTAMVRDYLALSDPDRRRARGMLRALLNAEAQEGTRETPPDQDG